MSEKVKEKIEFLYKGQDTEKIFSEIMSIIKNFKNQRKRKEFFDQEDVILITYGDQFKGNDKNPLFYLKQFCDEYIKDIINTIHILPFFPYSSDDGFSVIDYKKVDPDLGDWEDIKELSKEYRLMFDFVCNHISSKSDWFLGYLNGKEEYKDYFIEADPNEDLSKVVRPRALPLLTAFDTKNGKKYVWTTFSEDQIDLNYKNPKVLIEMIKILLYYIEQGADIIRLDAIGFLWKEIGTSCIHLEQTHKVVQLFRDIIQLTAKEVKIITETNVPHKDNISYFGDGYNEAHMVYQFPLPPLVLYTFMCGDSRVFTNWAKNIKPISEETAFFNFLASHDGVGLNPLRGIVSEDEINKLVELTIKRGGLVSYKYNPDGSKSPYELNISYFNALSDEDEREEIKIRKFLNAYSIALAMQGVPGIYIHSILGSQNYHEGVKITGQNRTINREKFEYSKIKEELDIKNNLRYRVYNGIKELLKIRKQYSAFHPNSKQDILEISRDVIATLRSSDKGKILALNNITNKKLVLKIDKEKIKCTKGEIISLIDKKIIITNDDSIEISLDPYEFLWLHYA
ncbi:sugar phosphorylase [Caloramator australicus]|uniref:Sucrose 6(F)-phosphate phosphorylase n=1 Tax=Caloramator australicus RC3 TaxID=857293 RepID=I7J4X6_9CLOT|nr:sugar phosphorylase [Caloramator australicus]CCJ33201.1 Putative sucrose phosphorylase [Caloramator australicus RC3]